jgi:hypothetical protein
MKKKGAKIGIWIIVGFFILTSCASIVSKTSRDITIKSKPEQADFTITDEKGEKIHAGKTPQTVSLSTKGGYFKGREYTVFVCKEGCESQTIVIKRALNGWYIGNILFGGLIGLLIVDPLTGAMWTLSPQEINCDLVEVAKTSKPNKNALDITITLLDDLPRNLRNKMVRIK